ncbi:hypothetical protein K493DRAFT_373150 [Basidiobolus meristosporus CBS 931.73]|uniref:Apple domain-containing protein n=1 Tax=Basidiobolus meristosporus CBS 931.73 TaxID=1314790 RepID=A0A1Y1YAC2_9FUNG|nr:hypothetical protein K493DRAFT_373150 [Basidiobolus meristosporus CBS 931.73]|eukprot:ORX94865.1 hypothetical protein K493DRAFT_373150 [Basidiobolus meristosporus CBS 931.73]
MRYPVILASLLTLSTLTAQGMGFPFDDDLGECVEDCAEDIAERLLRQAHPYRSGPEFPPEKLGPILCDPSNPSFTKFQSEMNQCVARCPDSDKSYAPAQITKYCSWYSMQSSSALAPATTTTTYPIGASDPGLSPTPGVTGPLQSTRSNYCSFGGSHTNWQGTEDIVSLYNGMTRALREQVLDPRADIPDNYSLSLDCSGLRLSMWVEIRGKEDRGSLNDTLYRAESKCTSARFHQCQGYCSDAKVTFTASTVDSTTLDPRCAILRSAGHVNAQGARWLLTLGVVVGLYWGVTL